MYRPVFYLTAVYISALLWGRISYYFLLLPVVPFVLSIIRRNFRECLIIAAFVPPAFAMATIGYLKSEEAGRICQTENVITETAGEADCVARIEDISGSKTGKRYKATLLSVNGKEAGEGYVLLYFSAGGPQIGDTVFFRSELKPYEKAENDGEFDLYKYYRTRKIYCYAYPQELNIEKSSGSACYGLLRVLYSARTFMENNLQAFLGKDAAGVLIAMLTGEKGYIEEELKTEFSDAGFSHILAISGLHISILGIGLFTLLRKMGAGLFSSAAAAMTVLGLFSLFTGNSVSCTRAVIMACLALLAKCTGRKYDPYTGLAVAALIILIRQPLYVTDSSFILSFMAGFIVFFTGNLIAKTEVYAGTKTRKKIIKAVLFAMCMQVMMLPVQLAFFYSFCPYTIVLNCLLLPLLSVLLVFGMAIGVVGRVLSCGNLLSVIPELIVKLYRTCTGLVSKLPYGRIVCGYPKTFKVLLFLIVIILFVLALKRFASIHCYWLMLLIPIAFAVKEKHGLEVYQLSVGQGDCAVIINDTNAVMIDCGSSDSDKIYKYTVQKFLNFHGFAAPDLVFASHSDADHTNGIVEMLGMMQEERECETMIMLPEIDEPSSFETGEISFGEILFSAETLNNCTVSRLRKGESVSIGGMDFTMLFPDDNHNKASENENSMVLYLRCGSFSALYTGDVSAEEEDEIIKAAKEYGLTDRLDLLKVAHHGSRFSTGEEFLAFFKPEHAFISCGKNNTYGHPADETVLRLKLAGCNLHVTAEEGMLKVAP